MPLRIGTQIQALPRSTLTSGSHPGSVVPAGHAPPDLIQKSSYAPAATGMRPVLCSASTTRTHFQSNCGLAWRSANDMHRKLERQSVVEGKSVSVGVGLGGGRNIKNK